MAYVHEMDFGNGKKNIVVSGKNSGWKYNIYEVRRDGTRLFMWDVDTDDDIVEYINSIIRNDGVSSYDRIKDFIIVDNESGMDVETIGAFCDRKGIIQ